MGRKHSFMGVGDADGVAALDPPGPVASVAALSGMGSRGAIGAVTRSIEQMRANGILDLAPEAIDASSISDRLEQTAEDQRALVESIREHGQQVPILVRPHPEREGRYQIVYGRRRLRALAELGRPVRAVVRPLSDRQLVVAQGQENSARTDLSFIERALFAAKLERAGHDRETIMAALSVDKTTLSRLISTAGRVPSSLVEAIGPAPRAGRDRWIELAARLEVAGRLERVEEVVGKAGFAARPSDERFAAVFSAGGAPSPRVARPRLVRAGDGTPIARLREEATHLTVTIDKRTNGEFASHLVALLPELYAAFAGRGEEAAHGAEGDPDPR